MAGKALDIKAALWAKAQEGEETAEVFRREARAIYEKDAESAAAFLLDAAFANARRCLRRFCLPRSSPGRRNLATCRMGLRNVVSHVSQDRRLERRHRGIAQSL